MRYWLAVASQDHVSIGASEGIVQVAHGRRAPLARMSIGDRIVYYSPKREFSRKNDANNRLRMFTALAAVTGGEIYRVEMKNGFTPYRRDAEYFEVKPAPIEPLIEELPFTSNRKNWGARLRFGFLEITREDMERIAAALTVAMSACVRQ